MDAQGIEGAAGAKIFGMKNSLTLSASGMSKDNDLVVGEQAEENLVFAAALSGLTNHALRPTNRVVRAAGSSLSVTTPPVPPSGSSVMNRNPCPVEVRILEPGRVKRWTERDPAGTARTFPSPLSPGQSFLLNPGDEVTFEYDAAPTWSWKAVR